MVYGDLKFYDKDFSILSIYPDSISVNWQVKFKEYGTAEIHLPKSADTVKLLTENKYLFITQGDLQGIVTGYKLDDECVIFAKTPEWLLTKFVVADFNARNLVNDVLKTSVSASDLACLAVESALPESVKLYTETDKNDTSNQIDFFCDGAKSLYFLIREILKDEKLGFSFRFNVLDKSFRFKVLSAKENEDVRICSEFKTIYDESFICDLQNEAESVVFYQKVTDCGKYDAYSDDPRLYISPDNYGKFYTVTSSSFRVGLDLNEGDIILCKDKSGKFTKVTEAKPFPVVIGGQDNGIFSWSVALDNADEQEAQEKLKTLKCDESFSFKTKNLVYNKDFFLGDILKTSYVSEGFSVTDKKIVTGVHLWEESEGVGSLPTMEKITEEEE